VATMGLFHSADIGRLDLEAVPHRQLMGAGFDLEVAPITQLLAVDLNRQQAIIRLGLQVNPGPIRMRAGQPERATCKAAAQAHTPQGNAHKRTPVGTGCRGIIIERNTLGSLHDALLTSLTRPLGLALGSPAAGRLAERLRSGWLLPAFGRRP